MASARAVVVTLLVAVLGFGFTRAAAQSDSPPVAWEMQLPKSIDWYVRTSSGVLLVRSGNILHAVDGKDGRELWSMDGLDLGDPEERGKNISEIPGTPILLLKSRDAKPRIEGSSGSLLGVDLWKGTVLWQQKLAADLLIEKGLSGPSTIENLMGIIPFYESDRVLLVNKVGKKGNAKPRLQLQNMLTGAVEWRRKYPFKRGLFGGIEWYEFDGQFYPYDNSFRIWGFGIKSRQLQRLDLQTGKKVWERNLSESSPSPFFVDGKIILARATFDAVDPLSGKRLWRIKGLGEIEDSVQDGGVIFAAGNKGIYAVDVSTGSIRWRVKSIRKISRLLLGQGVLFGRAKKGLVAMDVSTGSIRWQREGVGLISEVLLEKDLLFVRTKNEVYALDVSTGGVRWRVESETNPIDLVFFEESNKLVFCNEAELVMVEAESGKILRRDGLNMKAETFSIRKLGDNFLIVEPMISFLMAVFNQGYWPEAKRSKVRESLIVLYDVKTGEKLWEGKGYFEWFLPVDFLGNRGVGLLRLWNRLRSNWEVLRKRAMQNPGWQEVLDRLEPFIQEQESYQPVYFTSVPEKKNEWKLFRIDPSTGQRKEWYVTGSQPPDFIPAFGLAYTFTGDTLQAFRLSGE